MTDREIILAYLGWLDAGRKGIAGAKAQIRGWGEVLRDYGYTLAPAKLRDLLA